MINIFHKKTAPQTLSKKDESRGATLICHLSIQ